MKAIRVRAFGGPEVLKIEEVSDPKPAPGQVLVQIKAAGVNPVETYIRAGQYSRKPALPYTPGSDSAGMVISVGSGITTVKAGDRVYTSGSTSGTYAEKALCEVSQVHPLPSQISFSQGAALGAPYATADYALFYRAHALSGETVLIHGATGGVGTAAVQLTRARGLRVIGTGGTPKGRELVAREGAHHVLDHRAPDYLDQIAALTDGRGVDVVIEMLANVNLAKDLKVLAPGGRVVVVGSRGTVEIDPRETMGRNASILGMALFNATEQELTSIHAALGAGLENGTLRPIVGQEIPLAQAPRAHEAVMRPGACGKIVLLPEMK
jgi:NADPH2:quinone reductase